jgi:Fe2+ or Zn2+ uptake regulation protein
MNTLIAEVKKRGYRQTKVREHILKTLKDYPLSAQEIFASLKNDGVQVDLASVYRSVELFRDLGLIYEIEFGEGKKRYELVDTKNHHHHLVCNNCGLIEDVTLNDKHLIKEVTKKSHFKVDHHHLEFFGLCTNCQ